MIALYVHHRVVSKASAGTQPSVLLISHHTTACVNDRRPFGDPGRPLQQHLKRYSSEVRVSNICPPATTYDGLRASTRSTSSAVRWRYHRCVLTWVVSFDYNLCPLVQTHPLLQNISLSYPAIDVLRSVSLSSLYGVRRIGMVELYYYYCLLIVPH